MCRNSENGGAKGTDLINTWEAPIRDISLLCQISHPGDRPDLGSQLASIAGITVRSAQKSAWVRFSLSWNGTKLMGSLFVRRLVLSVADIPERSYTLSAALPHALTVRSLLEDAAKFVIRGLGGDDNLSRTYLIVNCDGFGSHKFSKEPRYIAPEWLDDGMTTFALRVFDARRNKVGLIRVSRHLTITYGLAAEVVTNLNNLIYEKILYAAWPTGSDQVFSLLGALSEYVLPTEVSLYTHRLAQRLAAFGVLVGVLFAAVGPLQNSIAEGDSTLRVCLELSGLYAGFAAVAAVLWIIIGRISAKLE